MKNFPCRQALVLGYLLVSVIPAVVKGQSTVFTRLYMKSGPALSRVVPTGASFQSTASLSKSSASVTSSGSFRSGPSGTSGPTASATSPGSSGNSSAAGYTPTGTNTAAIVMIGSTVGANNAITGVSFGASNLTKIGQSIDNSVSPNRKLEFWIAVGVSGTAVNVTLNWPSGQTLEYTAAVIVLAGVDPVVPYGTLATTTGSTTPTALNVPSGSGDIIIDGMAMKDNSIAVGASQTQVVQAGTNSVDIASSYASAAGAGATQTTMTWSSLNGSWAAAGLAIKGTSNDAVFTMSTPLCSDFTIKAGSTITVRTNATVTLNTVAGSPIPFYANLYWGGTNLIISMNSATNSGLGAVNSTGTLTWTGTLGSDLTIASGQSITLDIFSDYAAANIKLDYDDASHISYIEFPTNTYVNVANVSVYNAAYPAGSVIATQGSGGTTSYVRANVTDPFGTSDISNTLTFTFNTVNPQTGSLVNTAGCTKTFEYAWTPGVGATTYTIAAAAAQGTEGTVTATASTSFGVLPVNGLEMAVTPDGGQMRIDWSTIQESNTSHFVVERADQNASFQPIGRVEAAGNSAIKRTYQFVDPLQGVKGANLLQYRLRQVDLDGGFAFSKIISVRVPGAQAIGITPNPFTDHITVRLHAPTDGGTATLVLVDIQGRTIRQQDLKLQKGDHDYRVEGLEAIPAGMYYLRVADQLGASTYKVIKPGR